MIRNDDHPTTSQDNALTPVRKPTGAVVISNNGGGSFRRDKAANGAANLDGFLHALRRTWLWCLLLGVVLGSVAAAAVWWYVRDEYTAVAELRAYSIAPRVLNVGNAMPSEKFETFVGNIQQLLMSRATLISALGRVGNHPIILAQDDPEAWLAGRLNITNPKSSEILLVSVTVPDDDELAKDLANGVVEAYLNEVVNKEKLDRENRVKKLEALQAEKEDAERQKRTSLDEMAALLKTADPDALSLKQQIELTQSQQVKSELARIRVERMRLKAKLDVIDAQLSGLEGQTIPSEQVDMFFSSDAESRMIKDEITATEKQLHEAGLVSTGAGKEGSFSNAAVGRTRQRVRELAEKLQTIKDGYAVRWKIEQQRELRAARAGMAMEHDSLEELEKVLIVDADKFEAIAGAIGTSQLAMATTGREVERLSGMVDKIAQEKDVADIEKNSGERIELRSRATTPKHPNRPGRLVKASQAGLAGFLLPGVLIVLLDVRSKRVNSVKEVQDQLGLTVFGSVPMLPSQVTRRLGGTSRKGRRWQALLSESVNGIRANLLRLGDVRVVMVTSSVGGEGKTTVATQLAMSLARIGKRTALVDFDLPRPALNNVFGLPLEPGICDVLRNDYRLDEVAHEVSLPNLSIITSGIADASSSRYMNSARLAEVLDELREQFDYVIVDGSPLIPVADARVVSRYVDGAICCVLRDVSRLGLIQQATEILSTFNVRLLGTVVTAKQDTFYLSPQGDRESQLAAPKPR